jgi:hypothetical protein
MSIKKTEPPTKEKGCKKSYFISSAIFLYFLYEVQARTNQMRERQKAD